MEENSEKIRILIAKPGCDIHERGPMTLITSLRDAGMEVIYTGRYVTPEGVVKTALDEDVDIIALSDHTASMPVIAESVLKALEEQDGMDIKVIAGGLILPSDIPLLEKMGVTGNYGPGTAIETIIEHIRSVAK